MLRGRDTLARQLGAGPSRLDGFVPPEAILALLDSLSPVRRHPLRSALGTLRRSPLVGAARGLRPPAAPPVDRTTLLLRLLTLRQLV